MPVLPTDTLADLEYQKLIGLYKEYVIMLDDFESIATFCLCILCMNLELEELLIGLMIIITLIILKLVAHMLSHVLKFMERKANELLQMAERYESLNDDHKAIECCEKVVFISRILRMKMMERGACKRLAFIYKRLGNYSKMRDYSEKCVRLGKETDDKLFEGYGYLSLGSAISSLGNWREAISHSRKSVEIASTEIGLSFLTGLEELHSAKKLQALAFTNIGTDYLHLGDIQQGKEYIEKGLEIHKQMGDREEEGSSYMSLAKVYIALGQQQKAEDLYHKALEHIHKHRRYRKGRAFVRKFGKYLRCTIPQSYPIF